MGHQFTIEETTNPIAIRARELRASAFVLDTETNGTSAEAEVIELAIVRACDGSIVYNGRFRPKKSVGFSVRIHGITDADLRNEKPWGTSVVDELYKILNGSTCCAWNAPFDRRMLKQSFGHGYDEAQINWVCLMKLYSEFQGAPSNVKLEHACAALAVKPGDHSAKNDALAAARVLYKMAERAPTEEIITLVSAQQEIEDNFEVTMTASDFLIQFGWKEKKRAVESNIIVSEWMDMRTGRIFSLNAAIDCQRQRML